MPTYEYTCKQCGNTLEVFQSFADKPLKKCTECAGELQKVFHARGVVFKGSGFYATDSRGASAVGSNSDGNTSNGSGEATEAKKSPSKETQKPKAASAPSTD